MKNVLIISYFFPPLGGPGVQRIAKFVKYLPEFGWNPIVISVKKIEYIAYDETLEKEVDKAEIHRTESLDLMRILHKIERFRKNKKQRIYESANSKLRDTLRDIFPIDPKILWLPFAVKEGLKICRTQKIDLIFASVLPYTSALAAYKIAQKSNIPYVVDYRDLWQGKPDISYFSKWHYEFSKKWEQKILTSSSHVIMNTNRAKEKIQELFPMIPEHRFSVLYNGFDNEDFEHKKQIRKDDKIIFTYTGGFYGQRTPAFFLQAMKELNQEGFLLRNLLIRFVGNYVHARKEEILSYQISDNIDIISQVSHDESIEYLMDSDFLLLFIAKEKSEIVIPAKLFEYIAAKKPILAMVPLQGEAAELIVSLGTGLLAEIDDVSLIKSHILELCQLAKEQKINSRFHFSTDSIFQFERKIQTKSLAEIFNVTGK